MKAEAAIKALQEMSNLAYELNYRATNYASRFPLGDGYARAAVSIAVRYGLPHSHFSWLEHWLLDYGDQALPTEVEAALQQYWNTALKLFRRRSVCHDYFISMENNTLRVPTWPSETEPKGRTETTEKDNQLLELIKSSGAEIETELPTIAELLGVFDQAAALLARL